MTTEKRHALEALCRSPHLGPQSKAAIRAALAELDAHTEVLKDKREVERENATISAARRKAEKALEAMSTELSAAQESATKAAVAERCCQDEVERLKSIAEASENGRLECERQYQAKVSELIAVLAEMDAQADELRLLRPTFQRRHVGVFDASAELREYETWIDKYGSKEGR